MLYLLISIMTLGVLNTNLAYFSIPAIIIFLYIFRKNGVVSLSVFNNFTLFFLALFGLFYGLIHTMSISALRINFLTPILAFIGGWCMIEVVSDEKKDRAILKIIAAMILGFTVHALLNSFENITSMRSEITDVFYGVVLSATGAAGINTMIFSLPICLIMVRSKLVKTIGFVCLIISLWYSSILGSRTQIVILCAVFVVMLVLYLRETKSTATAMKFLVSICVLIGVAAVIYRANLFSVRTTVENSNLFYRLTISNEESDTVRYERFFQGVAALFKEPFGNRTAKYYHNLWLDVGRVSGIIPFLFVLAYSWTTTSHVIKIFKCKNINQLVRFTLLSIYLGLTMNFFVEPVIEGLYDIFLSFVFLSGAVECYYKCSLNKTNNIQNGSENFIKQY